MVRAIDHTGRVYGRLTVLREGPPHRTPKGIPLKRWWCRCECGNEVLVQASNLTGGGSRSCGCLNRERIRSWVGERHPNWSGDSPSYTATHKRVNRARGAARKHACVDCGGPAEHWSYIRGCEAEIQGFNGKGFQTTWCPHIECYYPRCEPCHRVYDEKVN